LPSVERTILDDSPSTSPSQEPVAVGAGGAAADATEGGEGAGEAASSASVEAGVNAIIIETTKAEAIANSPSGLLYRQFARFGSG